MNDLCTALLAAGFTEIIVSDLRLTLATQKLCRTVVLRGPTPDRFDYCPADASLNPNEILTAWSAHNAQV